MTSPKMVALMVLGLTVAMLLSGPARSGSARPFDLQSLAAEIGHARQEKPASFQAIARVRQLMPALDRKKRGPIAVVTPLLASLGSEALLPMLDELISDRSPSSPWTPSTRVAFRIGLLEAVGKLRDARSTPALQAILEGPDSDPRVLRACAAALGKSSDEGLNAVIRIGAAPGPRQLPALSGLGECRRLKVIRALAAQLSADPSEEVARTVARSLGDAAAAWAWETPALAALGEGDAARAEAAQSLLQTFVSYKGAAQGAAETSLLMIDAPKTLELIEARTSKYSSVDGDLARLAQRLRISPLRAKNQDP